MRNIRIYISSERFRQNCRLQDSEDILPFRPERMSAVFGFSACRSHSSPSALCGTFPVSFSFDETGARIKIWRTLLTGEKRPLSLEPGTVTEASKEGILVAAGDAMLRITELQGPSAKKMTAGEYVNGHKITKFT